MSQFVRIPPTVWRFSEGVDPDRIRRLELGPSYEDIVALIANEGRIRFHKRERAKKRPGYFRAVVQLNLSRATVDLFHNSSAGYRAQYYHCPTEGTRANKFVLTQLAPQVVRLLAVGPKRTCPPWWVGRSLLDSDAKVWIHQGLWLRHAKRNTRELLVKRWLLECMSQDVDRRKKAIWASLAPEQEMQLELKGGFLTLEGEPLGSLKPNRAMDLNELGFT